MNKHIQRGLVAVGVLAAAGAANAAAPDFTTLISAVDFTSVAAAVLAVAALKVVPGAVIWGARQVIGMVRR